jgi:hypothetical protein
MMYWVESFETLQSEIDGTLYKGFDLFKKVYEAFPDIQSMTKDEATEAGLYPIIHYRNFAARKWMAEMNGGIADVGVDLAVEIRPDDHRVQPVGQMVHVRRNNGAAPGHFLADVFGVDAFLLGDPLHLGGHFPRLRAVHLSHV